jgi:hypothetical protein
MATFDRSDGIGEVKIIRSDNAPEITQGRAKEMYDRKYITNIKSVPHEHDNSLVERVIQTINNIAVSQLALGSLQTRNLSIFTSIRLRMQRLFTICAHTAL